MSFDLSGVEVKDFTPLPTGDYKLLCTKAELKTTKSGDGRYISAGFTVTEGEHAKRLVFSNYNVENKNPQAVEIAFQDIKKFLLGAGIESAQMRFKSAEEIALAMLNKVGTAKITIDGDQNRIKSWKLPTDKTSSAPGDKSGQAAKALGF